LNDVDISVDIDLEGVIKLIDVWELIIDGQVVQGDSVCEYSLGWRV